MLCTKTMPFHLLTCLIFVVSAFLSVCHGAENFLQPPIRPHETSKIIQSVLVRRETWRRSLVDEDNPMILAAKRTRRKDPLDNFRYYTGGWDISEKHYFFSVAYTAAPLFIIAVIWFVGFAVNLLVICIRHCCCQIKNIGYSQTLYALSLCLLVFFTVTEIVGCVVLYTGEEMFNGSTTTTVDFVVNQADATVENLTTVSEYLSDAKEIGVDQIYLPSSVQDNIVKVEKMINKSAATLENQTDKNKDRIQDVLYTTRVTLITVAAVMLFLGCLGLLLSISGMKVSLYILTVLGWILATASLLLCCLFLILHNVAGDTCVAMDEWVQNPTAHTALDDILSCVDNSTAQATLQQSKNVTSQLVQVVNFFIKNVSNNNPPPNLPPNVPPDLKRLYYNQSGPLVPTLCNPLNSDLTDHTCSDGEVELNNASQEWSKYICQVDTNGTCTTVGRLTPEFYDQMVYAANVSYALHYYGPFLIELVDCSFVRKTFSSLVSNHCPGLNRFSYWVVIGLAMVSGGLMLSLIFWIFYARERRLRKCSEEFISLSAQNLAVEQSEVMSVSLHSYSGKQLVKA